MPCRPDPTLFVLACSSRRQLAKQVRFLRAENEILRSRVKGRVHLTDHERTTLIRLGQDLGKSTVKKLISIVRPETYARWLRKTPPPQPKKRPGPPRKPIEVRELVVRIAKECGFGFGRILGELEKVGIDDISKSTIRRIMIEAGIGPKPSKHKSPWDVFLRSHAETLWACDFFTKRVWTRYGVRTAYVLFFIHVKSRRVIASTSTVHPHHEWVAHQAKVFLHDADEQGLPPPSILIRDGDKKFGPEFRDVLRAARCEDKRIPRGTPVMNAHAERWVRSIKHECLNHFICFSEEHLDHLVEEYLAHYHTERPHQGIGNRLIIPRAHPPPRSGKIVCRTRLGGVLKSYKRVAA